MFSLEAKENHWQEALSLKAKNTLDRTQVILLLLFFFILLDFFLLITLFKPFWDDLRHLIPLLVIFLMLPLFILSLVSLSFVPRLISLKATSTSPTIELQVLQRPFSRKKYLFSKEEVKRVYLSLNQGKRQNLIIMDLTLAQEKVLRTIYAMDKAYSKEEISKLFLNLAHLLEMKSYRALSHSKGFIITLAQDTTEKNLITSKLDTFLFESSEGLNKELLRLPFITVKELSPWRIHLYKGVSFYDILRYLALFVLVPSLFMIAYQSKDPQKYLAMAISSVIYLWALYFLRNFLSPIEIFIDKLRGMVKIKKLFLTKTISLREIEHLEVKDVSLRRGPFVFHIFLRLKNSRQIHLFFIEIPSKETSQIQETFAHLSMLLDYMKEHYDFKVLWKLKQIEK